MTRPPVSLFRIPASAPALAVALSLGAAAAVLAAPRYTGDATPTPASIRGRDYAEMHCAGCHAIGETGKSPAAPAPAWRTLRGRWDAMSLILRLERSPVHDGLDMPPRQISDRAAGDLAAYLTVLRAPKPPRQTRCTPIWC